MLAIIIPIGLAILILVPVMVVVIKKRHQSTQLIANNNEMPGDDTKEGFNKQAVEDEYMKKELLKFAADLENSSSRLMLQP